MNSNLGSAILAAWLVATVLFILAWDVACIFVFPDQLTVSRYLWEWGHRYPLLYFLLGVGIGHILLPLLVVMKNGADH